MLFDPARHEQLRGKPWDAQIAMDVVEQILKETDQNFSCDHFWPEHPLDEDWKSKFPLLSLFWGTSSTAWTMLYFMATGTRKEWKNDYVSAVERAYASYVQRPD